MKGRLILGDPSARIIKAIVDEHGRTRVTVPGTRAAHAKFTGPKGGLIEKYEMRDGKMQGVYAKDDVQTTGGAGGGEPPNNGSGSGPSMAMAPPPPPGDDGGWKPGPRGGKIQPYWSDDSRGSGGGGGGAPPNSGEPKPAMDPPPPPTDDDGWKPPGLLTKLLNVFRPTFVTEIEHRADGAVIMVLTRRSTGAKARLPLVPVTPAEVSFHNRLVRALARK